MKETVATKEKQAHTCRIATMVLTVGLTYRKKRSVHVLSAGQLPGIVKKRRKKNSVIDNELNAFHQTCT